MKSSKDSGEATGHNGSRAGNAAVRAGKVQILTESALCVALSVVLSMITLFKMPMGGSVTPFATLPVIIVGLRHGAKWGVSVALVYSLSQLLLGMSNVAAVPAQTFLHMALCAMLDYVIAYTAVGLTGPIAVKFRRSVPGLSVAIVSTGLMRLACSFLSGVLIYGVYAPEGSSVALYSLAYNATWCLPDIGVTLAACLLLSRVRALALFPRRG